jgi:uncharacterized protein with GYD domain
MATYIVLINYTEKGLQHIEEWHSRLDLARRCLVDRRGRLSVYLTMGPYDVVAIAEAPSDEDMAAFLLHLGSYGNVRTLTLKAFNEEQFGHVIELMKQLPGPKPGA